MGEGLGAGGHATRRRLTNAAARPRFLARDYFRAVCLRRDGRRHGRPLGAVGRQFHLATVGKLKISQMDAKATLGAGATFDYGTCSNREPTGQTIDK